MTLLWSLGAAVQMLTRLPFPSPPAAPDARTLARSTAFYPLVGAVLGLLGWAVWDFSEMVWDAPVAAGLTLAALALLTGALHEDGLADVADAFGSQRTREGLLRVMKDSRIGAYGALTLGISLLVRWAALAALLPETALPAIVASQAAPRAGIALVAKLAGPATEGSGSALAASVGWLHVAASLALGAGVLAVTGAWWGAAALPVALLAAWYFRRRLGGVTGDCLGAAEQVQEIAVLLAFARGPL